MGKAWRLTAPQGYLTTLKNLHATTLDRIHGPAGDVYPVAWGKCVPTPGSCKDSSSGPSWFFFSSLQFFYPLLWLQRKNSSFANLGVILWPWSSPSYFYWNSIYKFPLPAGFLHKLTNSSGAFAWIHSSLPHQPPWDTCHGFPVVVKFLPAQVILLGHMLGTVTDTDSFRAVREGDSTRSPLRVLIA